MESIRFRRISYRASIAPPFVPASLNANVELTTSTCKEVLLIDDEKAPPARSALFSLNVLRSSSKVIPEEVPDCGTAIAAGTGMEAMRNSIS